MATTDSEIDHGNAKNTSILNGLLSRILSLVGNGQAIFIVVLVLILATNLRLIGITSQLNSNLQRLNPAFLAESSQPNNLPSVVSDVAWEGAPVRGSMDAPIQVVMFSDFQCPYCAASLSTIDRILEQYGDQVFVAYRHFPLSSHPEALPAAEAAECAKEQSEFWQMHDRIFSNQSSMTTETYREYAEQIGLNMRQFDACVSEHRYQDVILLDQQDGQTYGVFSTPTFFINGHRVIGAVDFTQFEQVIDSELATLQVVQ